MIEKIIAKKPTSLLKTYNRTISPNIRGYRVGLILLSGAQHLPHGREMLLKVFLIDEPLVWLPL